MDKQLKVYMITFIEVDEIDQVLAYFDSKEKAEAFLNRFKTDTKRYEIVEMPLNPKYIVNKLANPYLITITGKKNKPISVKIFDIIEDVERAEKEDYLMNSSPGFINFGAIEIMLMATDKKDAKAKAIKKRDELIASGEWDKVYHPQIVNSCD